MVGVPAPASCGSKFDVPSFETVTVRPSMQLLRFTLFRAVNTGIERCGNPFQVRNGQGGGAGIADPRTISRSAATLSDIWVG
jgi:hypothetical protein